MLCYCDSDPAQPSAFLPLLFSILVVRCNVVVTLFSSKAHAYDVPLYCVLGSREQWRGQVQTRTVNVPDFAAMKVRKSIGKGLPFSPQGRRAWHAIQPCSCSAAKIVALRYRLNFVREGVLRNGHKGRKTERWVPRGHDGMGTVNTVCTIDTATSYATVRYCLRGAREGQSVLALIVMCQCDSAVALPFLPSPFLS